MVSISIVSTFQLKLVRRLISSLSACVPSVPIEIILTQNPGESTPFDPDQFDYKIKRIVNDETRGFALNHNEAFKHAKGDYFLILNPDVIFLEDVFPYLIEDIKIGRGQVVAPLVVNQDGGIEDSFRRVPTPYELILRRLIPNMRHHQPITGEYIEPEWIAGMFLFMRTDTFASLGGFDPGYFMYFEDVDFGSRASLAGIKLLIDTRCKIEHAGQRASQSTLRYLRIHLQSAARFFTSEVYRNFRKKKRP